MNASPKYVSSLRLPFFLFAVALVSVAAMLSFREPNVDSPAATYSRGKLSLAIPYHADRAGSGRLTADILDPEDHVLGSADQSPQLAKGNGTWRLDITLHKPLPPDDIIWDRVRYRFEYSGETSAAIEGVKSISQILRRPVVHILAQKSYITGGPAAIRVIATDSQNDAIIDSGSVHIELLIPDHPARPLYTGRLNHRGTTEAQFRFPAGLIGDYQLHYLVETHIGSSESTQPVQLQDKLSILLTTEKPIYQPGQTIHVRALALDRADHNAAASGRLTFEVEDSRGNKVFKHATQTGKFGIASAEFSLADEVNLGTYHLRALIGDPDSATSTAELALNVERYVLPKFKVALEFADKDFSGNGQAAKRGYRPGDHVTGIVRANYFFGKPVDHAEIDVKASSMDVSVFEAASANGNTDADGTYHFDLKLPSYFAGRPLTQGVARVLVEATVKDSAGHSETRGEPITVSESPLLVTAIPEGGTLIPNLENQVFILTSYPDGTPATADLNIHASGNHDQHAATDAGGVTAIRIKAGSGGETLKIEAADKEGNRASTSIDLQPRDGSDQILLRTERAVYRAGDRIQLKVFSTRQRGSAYVDIVKDSQTILTRDLDLTNGEADLTLTATPEMAGTLDLNAYLFSRDAQPIADHRLVFVQPAEELHIETTADAPVYKPGDEARIRFHVTNSHGEGVRAALGLQIVDEAVFAFAEKQPGFAKVFFYLEQEAMKPRYEIHSISMSDVVEPVQNAQAAQRDRAARALFSATEMVNPNRFDTEFGRTLPQSKQIEYAARYQAAYLSQVRRIAAQLSHDYNQNPQRFDLPTLLNRMAQRDAWGTPLRADQAGWFRGKTRYYYIQSAGPDQQFGTADDLAAYVEVHSGSIASPPGTNTSTIDLQTEHDRGPFNGHAETTGSVTDATGAVIPNATVNLREVSSGKIRQAIADASGRFDLSALAPGSYEIEISAPGFNSAKREFTVRARDRAILSTTLAVGAETQTVSVTAETGAMPMEFAHGAVAAGGIGGHGFGRGQASNGRAEMKMFAPAAHMASPRAIDSAAAPADATPTPHIRSWFPEALYINPEIITDGNGVASITIPLADSITTWRMAMLASTEHGALGTGTSSLKVFQDFFVDLDLPVTLTQGDRVSIPVAVYNYSGERGDVSLKLQPDDWFSLVDDSPEKGVSVDSNRVGGSQFTLEAKRIGKFKLTLTARMKGAANRADGALSRADIVIREIEVVPNGREQNAVFNGRLEPQHDARHDINFPETAIPDASKIYVRLYPGPLSQVIEGMDSLLRMPYGCFEQTSSATYPNVLALDYMKRTKKLTPEVHAKAEGFIAQGYQRLLTFEVPGGGFSWFGQAPANKILTAYGLMEFSDMSRVYDVDPRLIQRTQEWLASQQQPDGSWKPDTYFINEGATTRYNSDVLRITAYIAWALENTGYHGPAVEKALQYVESHMNAKADTYTLAVVANFAVEYGNGHDKNSAFTRQAMQTLLDARTERDDQVWWSAEETSVYATGTSAAVETTGLAVQALLKWGQASATARKALTYIASKKDASGTWGTTQATIMALRALLLASEISSADVRGTVEVTLNGKTVEKLVLTPDNNDLFHQFVLKEIVPPTKSQTNSIQLHFDGTGDLAYQVVGDYFVPWPVSDKPTVKEALSIDVIYDRTQLSQNDIATATATIKNNLGKSANMVMVDLGIPPGFDLLSEDLQDYQEKTAGSASGRLEKFSLTATQAILYFNAFAPDSTVTLKFRLRAKYPIRAHTFQSRVYEYYDPAVTATAKPIQVEVRRR
jgi:uncharacterized protein YfaS (alpha-2-macroglobulin family)